ncbi:hypothetical protein FA15DRAFT_699465 [Coprinopsis marcescibilis]|uniref:Uncharacterized protein n=1 Tax=Coprinopsis marcescibilis TaxID=230819 RepID=A0A5C3LD88_COPMA|nr:hypothetical protein FA15DRAFT_699465 [Coprinopsis marcescibilis]
MSIPGSLRGIQSLRNVFRAQPLQANLRRLSSTSASAPWFIDNETNAQTEHRAPPSAMSRIRNAPPLPANTPQILKEIHTELLESPHLDISQLVVSPAIPPAPGPDLPSKPGQGRRKRGVTYAGESAYDATNGLWSWFIFAQVKEGTESRGAIDSVVRIVRKVLLNRTPPVPLPPKSRRQMQNGWAMVDAGNFAIHVLSKESRDKYFSDIIPR